MTIREIQTTWLALALVACGGAAQPAPVAPPASGAPPAASAAGSKPGPRAYEPTTLPGGEGPVPGSTWEAGRPSWLDGELLPKRAAIREAADAKDPDVLKERELVQRTRSMATADRFAWGLHTCTAPSYEQRVVTLDTFLADENRPSAQKKSKDLWWQVRVTCAPGKGDVGISLFRVIREGGKLDPMIVGNSPKLVVELKPAREVKEPEAPLPAPEPGAMLASGEGPLPSRAWEPGRPAWLEGEHKTAQILFLDEADSDNKARLRERDALMRERLVISASRVSYAGRVCTDPHFEQRLMKHADWLKERHAWGGAFVGEETWVVRIRCGQGKGDLAMELGRPIPKGKLAPRFSGTVHGFDVAFEPIKN